MEFGRRERLDRLQSDGRFMLVAVDHGMTSGPAQGITTLAEVQRLVDAAQRAGMTGFVAHRGLARHLELHGLPFVLQTMGMPQGPVNSRRRALAGIETALRMGAAAVAAQLDFGHPERDEMIADVAALVSAAEAYSVPVLVMVSPHQWSSASEFSAAVRVCVELGADIVKIAPGRIACAAELPELPGVPLVLPGGSDRGALAESLQWAARVGYRGLCVGRNAFTAADPCEALVTMRADFEAALLPEPSVSW